MTSVGGDAFWLIHDARTRRRCATSTAAAGAAAARRSTAFASRAASRDPAARASCPPRSPCPARWRAGARRTRPHGRLPLARVPGQRDRLRARRLPGHGAARAAARCAQDAARSEPEAARIFLPGGRAACAGSGSAIPDLARTLEAHRRARLVRLLRAARSPREMVRHRASQRRLLHAGDFAAQRATLGRAAPRHLSRRHDLRDAAADPGLLACSDAEPARAVRARHAAVPRVRTACTCWCRPSRSRTTTATAFSPIPRFADVPIERLISRQHARRAPRASSTARARCRGTACPPTAASPATRCTSPRSTTTATRPR